MTESRFNFLKDDFPVLYAQCSQAEQEEEYDVVMLKIRQALEYMVRDLGAQSQNLFQGINELEGRNILNLKISQRFHAVRRLINQKIHEDTEYNKNNIRQCLDDVLILTVWYGQKKGKKYILEQFSSGDMEIIHNILVNTGNLSIKNQNSTLEDNFNVDPLSLVGKFKASNIELQEQEVLKRGAFETTEEYKQRIADMDPIHIGCGILDAHRKDSYTDVNFLVHHIDHNPDIQFSPISAFYTIGVTETQIVDSELVAKLKVYKDKVCCDYSKVYLKNDSDLIAVHPIYWEKFFYETHAQYNKRISNMPLLPFGIGIPMSNKYDLKTGKLPVVINPFKYAEKILGNLLPEDMTIIIDCNRDMAKKICDSQIPCRLFLKLYTVEGVEKYVLWRKDIGEIVQANYCGITDWYKMVASWGSTQAMEKAERLEEIQENDCLRLGAAKGEAWAQNDLGNRYFYGDKVEQDYRQAAKWYRKAAEQGNVDAQYHLGICYNDGLGVKKDSLKALEWYRKAADQGNASAQYYLGICYYIGSGVEQDYRQAAEWYQKAANNGDADAQTHLGICYYTGQGVKQDWTKAVEWYQKAASQGNAWAQCNLGECYYDGDGVELDYQKAVEWFQKSADQGYARAQYNLGECYYNGCGVEKNYLKAVEWYQKAVEQGKNDLELQKDIRIALDRIQNPPQKKNSGCFITTAVCDSLNKSDDCYELTSFRRFRDNWLAAQVDGPVLIAEYYDVAPKIVESINMKDNRDEIYQQIWHDYLEPCLVMIEKGNYAACKNLYIKMVRNLQKEYAS